MTRWSVHPTPDSGNAKTVWRVSRNGSGVATYQTQQAAIDEARRRSNQGDTLIVHGSDGQIRDQYTVQA